MGSRYDVPILFSLPLVPKILDGTKTETRRLAKDGRVMKGAWANAQRRLKSGAEVWLYVREAWQWGDCICEVEMGEFAPNIKGCNCRHAEVPPGKAPAGTTHEFVNFAADCDDPAEWGPWSPGIHMPKWAATLWLRVAGVRLERLNDIDDASALAEGIGIAQDADGWWTSDRVPGHLFSHPRDAFKSAFRRFAKLRDDANPRLWVIRWDKVENGQREVSHG